MFIVISASVLFGGKTDLRVWFYNGEHVTTLDLSSTFYVPTYGTTWGSNSSQAGTYQKEAGGIGNAGYAFCNHDMTLTITTFDGRFVSQSDPTKYRDYYIALVPRYRTHTGASDDATYKYDYSTNSMHSDDERVPNTKESGNTLTVTGPHFSYITDSDLNVSSYEAMLMSYPEYANDPDKRKAKLVQDLARMTPYTQNDPILDPNAISMIRFWWDILICFDPLSSEDLSHLAEKDDYIARIQYTWSCDGDGACNTTHNGTGYIELRGYFNSDIGSAKDNVFIVVTPDVNASRLNMDKLIVDKANGAAGQEETIAALSITSPIAKKDKTTQEWVYDDHVKFFISASSGYQDDSNSFKLVRYFPATSDVIEIPFELRVYNNNGNLLKKENGEWAIYDGTEAYTGKNTTKSLEAALDLTTDYIKQGLEKQGNPTHQIAYNGYVTISVSVPDGYVTTNGYKNAANNDFSGIYKSKVYYHVVWEE